MYSLMRLEKPYDARHGYIRHVLSRLFNAVRATNEKKVHLDIPHCSLNMWYTSL